MVIPLHFLSTSAAKIFPPIVIPNPRNLTPSSLPIFLLPSVGSIVAFSCVTRSFNIVGAKSLRFGSRIFLLLPVIIPNHQRRKPKAWASICRILLTHFSPSKLGFISNLIKAESQNHVRFKEMSDTASGIDWTIGLTEQGMASSLMSYGQAGNVMPNYSQYSPHQPGPNF